jgi:phosphoglycolate phosphatase-like HAD superfamily hydrolase
MSDPQAALRAFTPRSAYFVGIDSDGCAFDTMEVKQKECFIPAFVKHFRLAAVSKYAREICEFINLYSRGRGTNRFPAYLKALDMLRARPEVRRRNFQVPDLPGLRAWLGRETKLGNPALKAAVAETGDPDLTRTLAWSEEVNRLIGEMVQGVPPFPMVRETLTSLAGRADVMVVSATPGEALVREWEEHGLTGHVALIAGQELGSKKEHLELAAGADRYPRDHVLMIGDAPGDQRAAAANGALFYPIIPGAEDESWLRLYNEGIPRFFERSYAGRYEADLISAFESVLPEQPPWKVA